MSDRPSMRVRPDLLKRLGWGKNAISVRFRYVSEEEPPGSGHMRTVEYLEPVYRDDEQPGAEHE